VRAFRFPLDRALHIRRAQSGIEQARLQRLLHDREQVERQAAQTLADSAAIRIALTAQPLLASSEISTIPDYQRGARVNLDRLDHRRQQLQQRIQEQKKALAEAERKVKLLEKLRARRFAEWEAQIQKELDNFAADAYLARWTVSR
jgi:flagellar export protein FliJ